MALNRLSTGDFDDISSDELEFSSDDEDDNCEITKIEVTNIKSEPGPTDCVSLSSGEEGELIEDDMQLPNPNVHQKKKIKLEDEGNPVSKFMVLTSEPKEGVGFYINKEILVNPESPMKRSLQFTINQEQDDSHMQPLEHQPGTRSRKPRSGNLQRSFTIRMKRLYNDPTPFPDLEITVSEGHQRKVFEIVDGSSLCN